MQDLRAEIPIAPGLLEESDAMRKFVLSEILEKINQAWVLVAESEGWPREEDDPHLVEYLP
jgi:hypothetical protein